MAFFEVYIIEDTGITDFAFVHFLHSSNFYCEYRDDDDDDNSRGCHCIFNNEFSFEKSTLAPLLESYNTNQTACRYLAGPKNLQSLLNFNFYDDKIIHIQRDTYMKQQIEKDEQYKVVNKDKEYQMTIDGGRRTDSNKDKRNIFPLRLQWPIPHSVVMTSGTNTVTTIRVEFGDIVSDGGRRENDHKEIDIEVCTRIKLNDKSCTLFNTWQDGGCLPVSIDSWTDVRIDKEKVIDYLFSINSNGCKRSDIDITLEIAVNSKKTNFMNKQDTSTSIVVYKIPMILLLIQRMSTSTIAYGQNILLGSKPILIEQSEHLADYLNVRRNHNEISTKINDNTNSPSIGGGIGVVFCCSHRQGLNVVKSLIEQWHGAALIISISKTFVGENIDTLPELALYIENYCNHIHSSTNTMKDNNNNNNNNNHTSLTCMLTIMTFPDNKLPLFENSFDFGYIDIYNGHDEYVTLMKDVLRAVKPGGLVMGSNFRDNYGYHVRSAVQKVSYYSKRNVLATYDEPSGNPAWYITKLHIFQSPPEPEVEVDNDDDPD
jgi:hypothetical protein